MSDEKDERRRFLVDRMLGPLCRYLRFMGYDAESANAYTVGNRKEDTLLLNRSIREDRLLLTRDRELAARGGGNCVLVLGEDVIGQVRQLTHLGLIKPELRLNRCSICNADLRRATAEEVDSCGYAPENREGIDFFWCPNCNKLYWMGSHGRNLETRIKKGLKES